MRKEELIRLLDRVLPPHVTVVARSADRGWSIALYIADESAEDRRRVTRATVAAEDATEMEVRT